MDFFVAHSMILDMGLSSQQVLEFIPSDIWTPVFFISSNKPNNDGSYLISTNEKYLKRCKDMYEMALHSYTFKKITEYQLMGYVAVDIEGLWCRGKMLSYNELMVENTVVELIDSGSIVKRRLFDLYELPDSYTYDPLYLAIKPVNNIPDLKFGQFYVQPLLLLSELHKGYVVVDTKPIDIINELPLETNFEEININKSLSSAIITKCICTTNESECSMEKLNTFENLFATSMEKQKDPGSECIIEFSNKLKEEFSIEKNISTKTLLNKKNMYDTNNIYTKHINNVSLVGNNLDCINEDKNFGVDNITINIETPTIIDTCIKNLSISNHHIFKNGSTVEFCYGTNIDFVFIRNYDQKQKYSKEMKQFYAFYKNKDNMKVKTKLNNGDMVAACLTQYNEIHRAVILDKKVKYNMSYLYLCLFIDIGCKEYVNSNNIFHSLEEVQNVPYLAHKVGMTYTPFNNTMQLKYLKSYFNKLYLQPLIIEFDESDPNGLNNVNLKNKSNNMNIYLEIKEFFQNTLANFQLMNIEEIEPKVRDYLNYNDVFKNKTVVLITHFYSINHIYVRINTPELTIYYNKIITEVHQYYVNNKGAYRRKIPKIGEKVAVKSPSKNRFVRAIISKMIDKTTYLVSYVDYGGQESIKSIDIYVLPYRFRHLPQTVIKIGLNGTLPISKYKELPNYFNQLIQFSVPLVAEFDEEDPFGFQKVILWKELNGVNIYEEICNLPET